MSPHHQQDTATAPPGHRSVADSLSKGASISLRAMPAIQGRGITMTSGAVIQRAKIIVGSQTYTVDDETSARNFNGMFQHDTDALTRMAAALTAEGRNDLAAIVRPPAYAPIGSGSFFSSAPFFSSGSPLISRPSSGMGYQGGYSLWGGSGSPLGPSIWAPTSQEQQTWGARQTPVPQERPVAYRPPVIPVTTVREQPPDILSPAYRDVFESLRKMAFLGTTAEKDFAGLEPEGLFILGKMLEALHKEDYRSFETMENDTALAPVTGIRDLMRAHKITMKQMAGELAAKVTTGMTDVNKGGDDKAGVHYAENYRVAYPDKWKETYRGGYTATPLLILKAPMDWLVADGTSASEALDAWFKGLTIAECYTTVLALQYKAIRDQVGKDRFDAFFGRNGLHIADEGRMRINITAASNPLQKFYTNIKEDANEGDKTARPSLQAGDWVYFYNHPKYLLKHPGGSIQGENAVYMGNGRFQGFGMSDKTEDEILDWMVNVYNAPRGHSDYRIILLFYTDKESVSLLFRDFLTPEELAKLDDVRIKRLYNDVIKSVDPLYIENGSSFPNKINKNNILTADAYAIGGTTRKGGLTSTRKSIKVSAVQSIISRS
ncbi:MAG: hypothetical protein J0H74_15085 [Chitinophagaceae bacterium]|nr:hypothetical protein [Chitinophagaceae bacterium]